MNNTDKFSKETPGVFYILKAYAAERTFYDRSGGNLPEIATMLYDELHISLVECLFAMRKVSHEDMFDNERFEPWLNNWGSDYNNAKCTIPIARDGKDFEELFTFVIITQGVEATPSICVNKGTCLEPGFEELFEGKLDDFINTYRTKI